MSFRNNWRRHIIIVEQSQSEQVRDEERENNAYQIFFHSFTVLPGRFIIAYFTYTLPKDDDVP